MGTSDVLKVLKIARAVGEYNLRTFKASQVTINHESRCFNGFQYAHMFYMNQSEICCDREIKHEVFEGF